MSITFKTFDATASFQLKTCCHQAHSTKKHLHHALSIGIVDQGQTNLKINNQRIVITAQQMIVIPAGTLHECKPVDVNTWKCRVIYIGGLYEYLVRDMNTGIIVYSLNDENYERINRLLCAIENNQEEIETQIGNLLFLIKNCTTGIKIGLPEESAAVHQVKDYIEKHYLEKLELGELEKIFCLNRYSLIKSFSRVYNITPLAYQKCLRIEDAKAHIDNIHELSSVAMEYSFYDQPHFTRYFKRVYGITPAV
jgi:AraC-like DNA-binding protein